MEFLVAKLPPLHHLLCCKRETYLKLMKSRRRIRKTLDLSSNLEIVLPKVQSQKGPEHFCNRYRFSLLPTVGNSCKIKTLTCSGKMVNPYCLPQKKTRKTNMKAFPRSIYFRIKENLPTNFSFPMVTPQALQVNKIIMAKRAVRRVL